MNDNWIPIRDVLPGFEKDVLVWYEYYNQVGITQLLYQDKRGWHWSGNSDHYITHWMPLPRGPKDE